MRAIYNLKALSHLHIWQQNARKSLTAQHYILNTNPSLFNLILIQEPWLDTLGNTRGNHHWQIIYPSNRYTDGHNTLRSIILINTRIPTNLYTVLNIPHSNISALHLRGDFGACSIFNIYNNSNDNSTIDALRTYLESNPTEALLRSTDHMLWIGDFNRHHPLWEEDRNRRLFNGESSISLLLDLLNAHNMLLSLPPGIPTYETTNGNWTRPDNVWRSNNLVGPIVSCNIKPSLRPPHADHLPIITELDLALRRVNPPPTCNMREANFNTINNKLHNKLITLGPAKQLHCKEDISPAVDSLVKAITEAVNETTPPSKPSPYTKRWWTRELTDMKKEKNWLSNLSYR